MKDKQIIKCYLVNEGKEVILFFNDNLGRINFNNGDKKEIKSLFNNILKKLLNNEIEIELQEATDIVKPAYLRDIAEEYIKQLNIEISNVKEDLDKRFNREENI